MSDDRLPQRPTAAPHSAHAVAPSGSVVPQFTVGAEGLTQEQCEVLRAVYDLYTSNPATWTAASGARNAQGNVCLALEESAVAWDLRAAFQKVCDDYERPGCLGMFEILKAVAGATTASDIVPYDRIVTMLERYLETLQ